MQNKEKKVQPTSISGNSTKPIVSGIPQRTYRFRGQKIDGSGWTYGSLVVDSMSNTAAIIDWADIEVGFMSYAIEEVKPETVGQLLVIYENVQYYENDIIKDWSGIRELRFEIMDDEQGCFLQLDDTDLCVLGNVFDNPELLG